KMFPESLLPKMKLADVFRAGNEFGEAIKVYDSIVAKNPDYIDVYKQLGLTYADYARFEDDKSLLDKGVENYFKYHGLIGESLDSDNELATYLIKNKHYKALGDLVRTKWYTRGDNFYMYRYRAIADFQNGKFADYARFEDDKSLLDKGVENYFKYHGLIGESLDSDNELATYLIKNKHYKALGDLVRTKWYTRGDNFYMYRYRAIADFQNGKFA